MNVYFVTPVVNVFATSLLTAAVWLQADPSRVRVATLRAAAGGIAVASHLALGVVQTVSESTAIAVAAGSAVAMLLTASSRRILGALLVADASERGSAKMAACRSCHRLAPRAAFCGQCGSHARTTNSGAPQPEGRV